MKKSFLIIVMMYICYSQSNVAARDIINVSRIVTENGKSYLTVGYIPFPLLGAQIRLDAFINGDKKTVDDIEVYFQKARELGVNCLQIPFYWNLIEPQKDVFKFTEIDKILEFANKYGLKIEMLWFSTNMIGDSFSFLVPDYVLSVAEKRFSSKYEGHYSAYYGNSYTLIFNDEWILERETNAVKRLMNHIGEWDRSNGLQHPVISVQVHNEPDGLARWRYDQLELKYKDGRPFTREDAWEITLQALNAVGKAVKESDYKVVTRTNIITYEGLTDFPQLTGANPKDVFDLDGIDFVSYDPYVSSIDVIKNNTLAFNSIPGNYSLIAENKGVYENTASLILAAVALGSGYNIYDLATSKFFIDNASPAHKDEIDHGVYTWDLKEKAHTNSVKSVLKGLTAAYPEVALCKAEDFVVFNVDSQFPKKNYTQTINSTRVTYSFSTSNAALGFALTGDDHILVYVTENADIQLLNGAFSKPESGCYNAKGKFVAEKKASLVDGRLLKAKKGVLYRIRYNSQSYIKSNTIENLGTKVPPSDSQIN